MLLLSWDIQEARPAHWLTDLNIDIEKTWSDLDKETIAEGFTSGISSLLMPVSLLVLLVYFCSIDTNYVFINPVFVII